MREYESISSLKLFEGCPRCYWLKYEVGLEDTPNPNLLIGSQVHKAIERYHKHLLPDELVDMADRLYRVYTENVAEDEIDVLEQRFLVGLENIATGEQLPVLFKGIIDGVNTKHGWVHEHKTSSNYWKPDDVAIDIQATGYAYGYYKLYGKLPVGIRFNILKKNKIKCKYQPLETYRIYEDLVYFFNWAKRLLEEIKTSEFEPKQTRFNSHHRACPYAKQV